MASNNEVLAISSLLEAFIAGDDRLRLRGGLRSHSMKRFLMTTRFRIP